MTIPSLLLGIIIASVLGTSYHAIRGGNGWRMLIYIILSMIGFFVGHAVGIVLGWGLYPLGVLEAGLGIVGSVLFLVLGEWLIPKS